MRRFLAILCTLAILCGAVNLAVFADVADNQGNVSGQVTPETVAGTIVLEEDKADLVIAEDT